MIEVTDIREEKESVRPRYCRFGIGKEKFHIDIDYLREVIELSNVFPVPQAPDYLYGLISLRGNIVPVIDLSRIYKISPPDIRRAKLIIIDVMKEQIGFISDELPEFLKDGSEITESRFIDINNFFENYRIKEE